jgi:hypothetical protein
MNLCDDFLAHMEAEDQRAEPTSVVAWGILNSTARLYRVHTRTAPPVAQLPPLPGDEPLPPAVLLRRFQVLERRHSSGDTTVIDRDRLKHTHTSGVRPISGMPL